MLARVRCCARTLDGRSWLKWPFKSSFKALAWAGGSGQAVIDYAEAAGFEDVVLESNQRLKPAISLYRSLGFIEEKATVTSDYARADIFMGQIARPSQTQSLTAKS